MNRFIEAFFGSKNFTIYTDISGKHFRFFGGTWAWRNHNLGNVEIKRIGKFHNQIGESHGFAVFPDDQSGHEALVELLKTAYANSSIDKMIQAFAPPNENDTKRYAKFPHKKTGVMDDTKIKDFTAEQIEKLWLAIQQKEGYRVGDIIEVFLVTGVHVIGKSQYQFCLNSGD